MRTGKLAALIAALAALGYLALSVQRAIEFETAGLLGQVLALSILAIAVISLLLILRELQFGFSMSRMAKQVELQPQFGADQYGRVEARELLAEFEQAKQAVESNDQDWRSWFRLAIAYDLNRDRKRARFAMRQAEKLFRNLG